VIFSTVYHRQWRVTPATQCSAKTDTSRVESTVSQSTPFVDAVNSTVPLAFRVGWPRDCSIRGPPAAIVARSVDGFSNDRLFIRMFRLWSPGGLEYLTHTIIIITLLYRGHVTPISPSPFLSLSLCRYLEECIISITRTVIKSANSAVWCVNWCLKCHSCLSNIANVQLGNGKWGEMQSLVNDININNISVKFEIKGKVQIIYRCN